MGRERSFGSDRSIPSPPRRPPSPRGWRSILAVSPLGKIRLGGKDATPDFGYVGWFALLFAAGMGIGLMYFGVSEPMSHFASSMGGTSVEAGARTD